MQLVDVSVELVVAAFHAVAMMSANANVAVVGVFSVVVVVVHDDKLVTHDAVVVALGVVVANVVVLVDIVENVAALQGKLKQQRKMSPNHQSVVA